MSVYCLVYFYRNFLNIAWYYGTQLFKIAWLNLRFIRFKVNICPNLWTEVFVKLHRIPIKTLIYLCQASIGLQGQQRALELETTILILILLCNNQSHFAYKSWFK